MTQEKFTEEEKKEIVEIYNEISSFNAKAKALYIKLKSEECKNLSERERLLLMDKLDALYDLCEINKSLAEVKLNGKEFDFDSSIEVANMATLES